MIDCIIINWNSGDQLSSAVESIHEYGKKFIKNIIIVDNASSDNSIELAEFNWKLSELNCSYILNTKNLGFGAACNQGFAFSSSQFILMLNPDARVLGDSIASAMNYLNSPSGSKVGICGVQLIDESGQIARSCTRFPHPASFFAHSLGFVHFFPRLGHFMTEWAHDKTREVDHVIGAFFLVRRSVFQELHGFDERFFVYLEDLDFSYRAHQAGWKTVYLAEAQAFHAGGGTSNQVKARRLFYSLRSRLLYAFKHFGLVGAWVVVFSTLLLEPLTRTSYALLRRSWPALKETWSGYAMLYSWLPQWVMKGVTR